MPTRGYVDFGSSCTIITEAEAERLKLSIDFSDKCILRGYGNGKVWSRGATTFDLKVDEIVGRVKAVVVPESIQEVPILIGRSFTELPGIFVIKDTTKLQFIRKKDDLNNNANIEPGKLKFILRAKVPKIIPSKTLSNIETYTDNYVGDVFVDIHLRTQEGQEAVIPPTVIQFEERKTSYIPFVNLSDNAIKIKKGDIIARARACEEEKIVEQTI